MARGTVLKRKSSARSPAGPRKSASSNPPPIRVVVADEHVLDRKGLVALLASQPDVVVVGEAAGGREAVAQCQALEPAVLILDTCMSDIDGVPAICAARAAAPATHVLALTAHGAGHCLVLNRPGPAEGSPHTLPDGPGTDGLLLAVMRGATGAIRRTATPEDLFRAVRAVAVGNAWIEPETAARLVEVASHVTARNTMPSLSIRDLQVAALIADGQCNKEIARVLDIGEPTVKKHVGRLLNRFRLQDRLQIGLHVARHPEILERIRT